MGVTNAYTLDYPGFQGHDGKTVVDFFRGEHGSQIHQSLE